MIFRRKIYDRLLEWKNNSEGRTALLVEGPRRVGKSTIVEYFARQEYESYILIDFSNVEPVIRELFDDISDLNYIFLQLQLRYGVDLHERKSLIIFDEVQLCPRARQAIKHLVKDHRYDYIETGSLISIHKNVKDILIPSEESKISMAPMDFEEFLWAKGNTVSMSLLKQCFEEWIPIGEAAHRKMMQEFRLYMLVGGMPQAVETYLETNNLREVDRKKREIISLYEDDFRKIDPTGRISILFDNIPAELNKNTNRYQSSRVIGSTDEDRLLTLIAELNDSRTVLTAWHVNDPEPGLSAYRDISRFKLYLADTGLFTTLMFKDKDFVENEIYTKLLNDKLNANLGYLYENVVAQLLAAKGDKLFYHTIWNEQSKHYYEIDFLLARKNKICPIEVKSSGYKTHKSLDVFTKKYSDRILHRYLLYTKDLSRDRDLQCVPVYMTQFL